MRTYQLICLLLFATTILSYSCKKESDSTKSGRLDVYLSDNPVLYDEVNIDIQAVEVHSDANGWQTIATNVGILNLLDYANGPDTLIASAALGVGRISQIRLVLGSNNTVVINGTSFNLDTPSAQESGLKLNINADILPGAVYAMELDFDAARSIVVTGSGKYILKPVIRVITTGANGGVRGFADPAISRPTVYAIIGTDTTATIANLNGYFEINGLASGSYTVVFDPLAPFVARTINGVSVTTGLFTDMGGVTIVQ